MTDLTIRQLPFTPPGQQTYWDITTPAFGLRVGTRSKSFVAMYGQKRKLKTLGRYPDISLADARLAAKRVLVSKPASPEVEISYDDARKCNHLVCVIDNTTISRTRIAFVFGS